MEDDGRSFVSILDADMRRARINQEQLARDLNVSQQSVSAWRRRNMLPVKRESELANYMKKRIGAKSELYMLYITGELRSRLNRDRRSNSAKSGKNQLEEFVSKLTDVESAALISILNKWRVSCLLK
jgi:transcriptional regulator with XRE-family HTH domain